ncbi:ribonuclease H-like domain-containing protein [Tanacetum coccineum]
MMVYNPNRNPRTLVAAEVVAFGGGDDGEEMMMMALGGVGWQQWWYKWSGEAAAVMVVTVGWFPKPVNATTEFVDDMDFACIPTDGPTTVEMVNATKDNFDVDDLVKFQEILLDAEKPLYEGMFYKKKNAYLLDIKDGKDDRKYSKRFKMACERRITDGVLRHPADSQAWHIIDEKFPEITEDTRNLRLGISLMGLTSTRETGITNVAESIVGTLLHVPRKTKDGLNARLDLAELGVKPKLFAMQDEDKKTLPPAGGYAKEVERELAIDKESVSETYHYSSDEYKDSGRFWGSKSGCNESDVKSSWKDIEKVKACMLAKAQASEASSKAKVEACGSKVKVEACGSKAKLQASTKILIIPLTMTFAEVKIGKRNLRSGNTDNESTDMEKTDKRNTDKDCIVDSNSAMSKEIIDISSNSSEARKGASKATAPIFYGPSTQGLLDAYGYNTIDKYLSWNYFPNTDNESTDMETTNKRNIDKDCIVDSNSAMSKGKYVPVCKKHKPNMYSHIPVTGSVLGLSNVTTWDEIEKKMGARK